MSKFGIIAAIPFVFKQTKRCLATVNAATKAGAIGILNLEFAAADNSVDLPALKQALLSGTVSGIKCGVSEFERWQSLLVSTAQPSTLILVPGDSGSYADQTLKDIIKQAHQTGWQVLVEAVTVEECRLAQRVKADGVIAKGNESGGRVADETAFVLLQRCLREVNIPVWAQGGIGKHIAAGCYAAGAAGVVLDSQLLLARESVVPVEVLAKFARLDGSETFCLSGPHGQAFRLFARGGQKLVEEALRDSPVDVPSWTKAVRAYVAGSMLRQRTSERVMPIGQDIALAAALAKEYCTTGGIVQGIAATALQQVQLAARQKALEPVSALAQSHGTQYPILQGAMTRVSDTADFALQVAKEGALPFLALALMRGPEIETLLSECRQKLAQLPWGVGILGFVPEQLRKEQMEVILRHKPPFALIAGGRPDQAKALDDNGIASYLHVPSALLLKSFMELGSRRFIFEGRECGGHVGPRSSFVLWESMISTLLAGIGPRDDASAYHVVFAGGIHDSVSAAMVAAIAAPLVAKGVRVGFLMGTAYLFTQQAVSAGAIVEKFQESALKCEQTVLLETGPGHAIRIIDSPYRQTFDAERCKLEKQGAGRDEIREQLELMNLGRLRIASKGLARVAKKAQNSSIKSAGNAAGNAEGLQVVSGDEQWSQGMYMIGQVAAMHKKPVSIKQLHEDVCLGGSLHLQKLQAEEPSILDVVETDARHDDIAIVGMSCLFPQAQDVESFWRNILEKVDAIGEVPLSQWDWRNYYDADPLAKDKIVSKWGGFLEPIKFDPMRYGIPPSSLASIDPMQVLILEAARKALDDAGYGGREFPRQNTSVILANAGHGPITALYSLRSMLGWKLQDFDPKLKQWLQDELPDWTEDSFAGYLGNVTAGRVANRFDLGGINFSIDAACASSLAALYVAVNELRSRTSDVVLLSATDTHNQPGDYLSFSKTHALSPNGRCRTFDAAADGIVISEGIAMLVLKRLPDAERDGDRIYAVVKGIGGSSDGRDLSLTAPRPAGQMMALDRAYKNAGVSPASVTLVEAHGTGTVAGDKAEIEALQKVFRRSGAQNGMCAVGSVKTNIGHTKAAAGLASIIKIAKSLYHKTLPPTIGVKVPNPACKFPESPFYINSELRPWLHDSAQPRRAGVSAFGFGGTNFHTVLEEYVPVQLVEDKAVLRHWPSELFVLQGDSAAELSKQVQLLQDAMGKQQSDEDQSGALSRLAYQWHVRNIDQVRLAETRVLAVVANSLSDLQEKLQRAAQSISSGEKEVKDPRGLYYAAPDVQAGDRKIACLFPGQGSQQVNMLRDLSLYFPQVRKDLEQADKILRPYFANGISSYIYPSPVFSEEESKAQQNQLTQTEIAQPAVGACDLAVWNLLIAFGIKPDMLAGHSYGEYVALCAAGIIGVEDLLQVSARRGQILSAAKNGVMAAVAAEHTRVEALIKDLPDVTLANINSPKQCILAGDEDSIASAMRRMESVGLSCRRIAVSAAFHSPHMKDSRLQLEACLKEVGTADGQIPVYSNLTAQAYAADYSLLPQLLGEHLISPVKFMQQVQSMYEDGARIFVEAGPGMVLSNLVDDILSDKPHLTTACDRQGRNGATQIQHMLGQLAVHGVPLNLNLLYEHRFDASDEILPAQEAAQLGKKIQRNMYLVDSAKIVPVNKGAGAANTKATPEVKKSVVSAANVSTSSGKQSAMLPLSTANNAKVQGAIVLSQSANQSVSQSVNQSAIKPGKANLEQVMLQYQQTMLQMTNSFLQAQQNVMMAYLQTSGQNGTEVVAAMQQSMQSMQGMQGMQGMSRFPSGVAGVNSFAVGGTPALPALQQDFAASAPIEAGTTSVEALQSKQQTVSAVATPAQHEKSDESSADELVAGLIEIVSQRTGYPPEMLDPSLDLESDLGIDSIKRVEILSSFRKLLPESKISELEGEIEKLAGTKTLQGIIDWIRSNNNGSAAGNAVASPAAAQSAPAGEVPSRSGKVSRATVATVELPELVDKTPLKISSWLIADAGSEVAPALSKAITSQGHQAIIVSHAQSQKKLSATHYQADLTSPEQVDALLTEIRKHGQPIRGLFHLPALSKTEAVAPASAVDTRSLFVLAKALHGDLTAPAARDQAAVVVATSLGGQFGTVNDGTQASFPGTQGGVVGIAKTLAREWTEVQVKAVDFAAGQSAVFIADKLLAEAAHDDQVWEVGYPTNGKRIGLEVISGSVSQRLPSDLSLDKSSVVLVTGGARGITAEIALELARQYQPTLVVIGRLARPEANEAADTASLTSARDLKAAIMERFKQSGQTISIAAVEAVYQKLLREREIRANLDKMQQYGSAVRYYSLDVRDETALSDLVERLYESLGRIDGVIHGAGVIEDAFLRDKSQESFDRVYLTKVSSAITLSRCLRLDDLKFFTLFSSVVGRTGNAGQADYVAANETINKLAVWLDAQTPARVASIMWGPWNGGMAQPELEAVFARYGWSMIDAQDGRNSFIDELTRGHKGEVEVLLVGQLESAVESNSASNGQVFAAGEVMTDGARLHHGQAIVKGPGEIDFALTLNLSEDKYLHDHCFDGIPVLPMAMAMELIAEAALAAYPQWRIVRLQNLDIPAGIVFDGLSKDIVLSLKQESQTTDLTKVQIALQTGKENRRRANFRATVELIPANAIVTSEAMVMPGGITAKYQTPNFKQQSAEVPTVSQIYDSWLFHGPIFQGIVSLDSMGVDGISGQVNLSQAAACLQDAAGQPWAIDPIMWDSAMQLAGVWARKYLDMTVLPTGFSSFTLLERPTAGPLKVLVDVPVESKHGQLLCNVAVYDQAGKLVMLAEGLGGIGSRSFNRLAAPAKELRPV